MHRLSRVFRRLGSFAITLLLIWVVGLALFIVSSVVVRVDTETPTDAVVVLTGGRLRLESGLALLAEGKAKKLFISGVNPRVDRDVLLRALGPAAEREACCIVVGHEADNTYGNARETAGWMRGEGYRSLRLVTSWYHMRRSLLEFSRAMPRSTIVAHPVFAHHVDPEGWWGGHGAVSVVIGEYHKYLAAWMRPLLDRAFPPPPAVAPLIRTTGWSSSPSAPVQKGAYQASGPDGPQAG
jgi:uncharacterized SAM-binding protein YcdF (DUF218 family)